MKSFVVAIMLLSFLMGSGYTILGHSSKKCDEHPWEEVLHKSARVSQDKCGEDPWSDAN